MSAVLNPTGFLPLFLIIIKRQQVVKYKLTADFLLQNNELPHHTIMAVHQQT